MTSTVCHVGDEVHILALLTAQQAINGVDKHLDDVDVLPLIETTDIIGISNLTLMEDEVDGTGMIDDIEPVANVLTLAINRQRLAMADIIDEQRNQFLRELIGAVARSGRKKPLRLNRESEDCTSWSPGRTCHHKPDDALHCWPSW